MKVQSENCGQAGSKDGSLPIVAVVACDEFAPYQLSVPCIVFGNFLPDVDLFDLRICSVETGILNSNFGLQIDTRYGLDVLEIADIIVIPFWRDPAEKPQVALLDALVSAHERGATIVGLCLGGYVLAYAGLLNNRSASTHWEVEGDFTARFPDVKLDPNALYVDDDGLITSAGTGAGLDCCLHIVRQIYGSNIANRVAQRMVIPPYREGRQVQFIEQPIAASNRDTTIVNLLDYLCANLSEKHDLDTLAERSGMSRRTFTRHFLKSTGLSLGDWLMIQRLQRSQELLETTSHGVERIAEMVGFQSACTLRQHFKKEYGISPREWRKNIQTIL
ncbi:GlxA family transcriptional regulator [Pseudomonas aeruginosa]|uniref:Putative transcriptional regulator n=1 Tax=Pseudomonas aeruginosa TaxID=287 RepID=Q8GPW2_PSEAI|nr:helix-turn-helix domain-containing protein [Pseudomonas aeruginosa]AAN62262.1 putative transcriptional regulator [Pseudomonas aeruginosa]OPE38088.1 AraC family transcriptional regulator [Pseudomonas aeruginosa]RPU87612.1 AraC family transcriptional regulator [Pseudomonas aeruginosa]UFK74878.1 helix-turn-helix domain-containing protein [Pseudomonas aeruginosa SG17M]WCW39209.1 helix-turn-helix domain-containing protein [Pseudomonas aeruginosa]